MSTVYLGYDARLGRRVALKALRSHSDLDRETRARLLREGPRAVTPQAREHLRDLRL